MTDPTNQPQKENSEAESRSARRMASGLVKEARGFPPLAGLLSAAAFGFLLKVLPVGQIIAVLLRVSLALLKPAVLIFGALKLVSILAQGSKGGASQKDTF